MMTLVSRHISPIFVEIRLYLPQISVNELLKKNEFFWGGYLSGEVWWFSPKRGHFVSPSSGNIPWKFCKTWQIFLQIIVCKTIFCKTILLADHHQSVKSVSKKTARLAYSRRCKFAYKSDSSIFFYITPAIKFFLKYTLALTQIMM